MCVVWIKFYQRFGVWGVNILPHVSPTLFSTVLQNVPLILVVNFLMNIKL